MIRFSTESVLKTYMKNEGLCHSWCKSLSYTKDFFVKKKKEKRKTPKSPDFEEINFHEFTQLDQ
jgi:hypothetical protein